MSFSIEHINPQKYEVNAPSYKYSAEQASRCVFSVAYQEKIFSASGVPVIYTIVMIVRPTYFVGSSPVIDSNQYAPGGSIVCNINIINYGIPGEKEIFWELINDSEEILSFGSQLSGVIKKWESKSIALSGITAPETYQHFRIRVKITETGSWLYSSYAYCLPVDLTVTLTHPGSAIYWPETAVDCHIHVTNAGFSGSQTIEWEVIKTSDQSVLSSGSQSSGTIADFASAQVSLIGITSPSGGDVMFKIRARIQGDPEWIYSMQMANYIYITPPENPIPRG